MLKLNQNTKNILLITLLLGLSFSTSCMTGLVDDSSKEAAPEKKKQEAANLSPSDAAESLKIENDLMVGGFVESTFMYMVGLDASPRVYAQAKFFKPIKSSDLLVKDLLGKPGQLDAGAGIMLVGERKSSSVVSSEPALGGDVAASFGGWDLVDELVYDEGYSLEEAMEIAQEEGLIDKGMWVLGEETDLAIDEAQEKLALGRFNTELIPLGPGGRISLSRTARPEKKDDDGKVERPAEVLYEVPRISYEAFPQVQLDNLSRMELLTILVPVGRDVKPKCFGPKCEPGDQASQGASDKRGYFRSALRGAGLFSWALSEEAKGQKIDQHVVVDRSKAFTLSWTPTSSKDTPCVVELVLKRKNEDNYFQETLVVPFTTDDGQLTVSPADLQFLQPGNGFVQFTKRCAPKATGDNSLLLGDQEVSLLSVINLRIFKQVQIK